MQHHELKNYLELTVNKKADKMKKHKNFCIRTVRKFFKIWLLKKDAQLVINDTTRARFKFLKPFLGDFVTGVSHRIIWTVWKTDSGHAALLTDNFFISNPEILYSQWTLNIFSIRDAAYCTTSFWIASYEIIFLFLW